MRRDRVARRGRSPISWVRSAESDGPARKPLAWLFGLSPAPPPERSDVPNQPAPQGVRRLHHRLGSRRRNGRQGPHRGRSQRSDAGGRAPARSRPGLQGTRLALSTRPSRRRHRRRPARHRRRVHGPQRFLGNRRRALHHCPGVIVPLVPLADRGRQDQPLGPHRPPLRRGRLPPPRDSTAWATTGPSPTKNSRHTTTRSSPTSECSGSKENIPNAPDGIFHAAAQAALHRDAASRKPAISFTSPASRRAWPSLPSR